MALAFQMINVGTVANDGTGDPLRTAFIKVNTNYGTIDASFTSINAVLPKDTNGNLIPAAPLDSPHFTGDPQVLTTLAPGDNDKSIPNTEWVRTNFVHFDPANPPINGTDLAAYAPLASPLFTGDPRSTTPPLPTDNDNSIPTTAWVRTLVASGGGGGIITPTPPPTPTVGQFWYDLTTGVLSIYIDDGNTKQWVAINGIVATAS